MFKNDAQYPFAFTWMMHIEVTIAPTGERKYDSFISPDTMPASSFLKCIQVEMSCFVFIGAVLWHMRLVFTADMNGSRSA